MDITPIYELRTRLRSVMIAGTNLLSEDFRLKKAVEGFAPLCSASPVFGKINELAGKLLDDNSPGTLIDTITLTDAVITTLGTTEANGIPENISIESSGAVIVNSPYSQLSAVINALTVSGSGNFNTVQTAWNDNPDLFKDYRVTPALVQGLGASYSELADLAEDILSVMGKNIVPFLKRGFDPKGKKEMVRRVFIIENLCGADENNFYLEQLKEAEKDVRKVLIYALRHDARNIDKLIELTKTEKGKAKTAALAALMSYGDEQAEGTALIPFFEEYSKKKPKETAEILKNASSKWTSELAAQVADNVLTDDSGKKITFVEASNMDRNKLKSKDEWFNMSFALLGKFGEKIEKIYRDIDNPKSAENLDECLLKSIIVTNDEGLKALALELNNSPKTKDCYMRAEAIARLLSAKDSSTWFMEHIETQHAKSGMDVQNDPIRRVLYAYVFTKSTYDSCNDMCLFSKNKLLEDKYYTFNEYFDIVTERAVVTKPHEILQPIKGSISDAMINASNWAFDMIFRHWGIDKNDKEYCEKIGQYACDRLRNYDGTEPGFFDEALYCELITKCGFWNVENLAADYFKGIKGKCYTVRVQRVVQDIPGDNDYRLAEAHAIIDLARNNKPAWFNIEEFENWVNMRYANK